MQDTELNQQILGLLSPWRVGTVSMDVRSQEITVQVEHFRSALFLSQQCRQRLPCYDHRQERHPSGTYTRDNLV